jgi:hypothetical protein
MNQEQHPEMLNTADGQSELNPITTPENLTEGVVSATVVNEPADPVAEATVTVVESFIQHEETHVDEETHEVEHEQELPDFKALSKDELLAFAQKSIEEMSAEAAIKILRDIKPILDEQLEEEMQQALAKFVEEGGTKDDFEYKANTEITEQYNQLYKQAKQKRDDEKKRIDAERSENLQKKLAILDEIKKLTEEDEQEGSFKKLKELQSEFKTIRNIPKEHIEKLWESYKILEHKFFDRLTINNELKDLDRRKNLGYKIELIEKVSQLIEEMSPKRALISLKKYQDEWRGIGPVPKEANEDIWTRFKGQCDAVYEKVRAIQVENEKVREENLAKKKELLAKALELSNFASTKTKEWVDKTAAANELMEAWKQIGMVPLKYRESIWDEFRNARNEFFNKKNAFFKNMNAERNNNLKVKNDLCEKAEAIAANPIDWAKQTEELKKLQDNWKKSGPVHEKISEVLWKRFRLACDQFFEKKAAHYSSQIEEQKNNLEVKTGLLTRLENLLQQEQSENLIGELKEIQETWNRTGFVPMSDKARISAQYNELNDKVFSKFKEASNAMREIKEKSQWEAMLNSPNGIQRIKREERILMERIKGIKSDMDTWDNNLGFFGKSNKGENPMVKQIEEKIAIARKNVGQLEDKLKALRQYLKSQQNEGADKA